MARSNSYSWMPGWLRKFLNLDDELPNYGPSSFTAEREYSAPPRPAVTYTPPTVAPRYTPMTQGTPAQETTPRFTSSYSPPPPPPPPAAVRPDGAPGMVGAPSNPTEGYIQPIGYVVRSYARGALPPQGLEQFTREFRATLTDVWNFYSYWTRFQTDELVRLGKEAADVVLDNLPASPGEPGSTSGGARRIKVTVGNGNGEKKVATASVVGTAPEPTPAAPPAPPAPTAVFSAPVTADDAEVPPSGRTLVDVPPADEPASDEPASDDAGDKKAE